MIFSALLVYYTIYERMDIKRMRKKALEKQLVLNLSYELILPSAASVVHEEREAGKLKKNCITER